MEAFYHGLHTGASKRGSSVRKIRIDIQAEKIAAAGVDPQKVPGIINNVEGIAQTEQDPQDIFWFLDGPPPKEKFGFCLYRHKNASGCHGGSGLETLAH